MSTSDRTRQLISAYCSGNLSRNEFAELETMLRESPQVRRQFVEYRGLEAGLRGLNFSERGAPSTAAISRPSGMWRVAVGMSAAAVVMAAAVGIWVTINDRPLATVTSVDGVARWTADGGRVVELSVGDSINGGTVETIHGGSSVMIRYRDRSEVELTGETVVVFSAGQQKKVHVRRGTIAASVTPQPARSPLVVQTPTAEVAVLGTRFEIDADDTATRLHVLDGAVRATRKADGVSVEVPAGHELRAGCNVTHQMEAVPSRQPAVQWQRDLASGPAKIVGDWLPADATMPARLRAVPFLFQKGSQRKRVVYRTALEVEAAEGRMVQIAPDSVITVSGQIETPCEVEVMLSTRHHGQFSGNFFFRTSPSPGEPFQIRAAVSEFTGPVGEEFAKVPAGATLRTLFAITVDVDGGLEVTGASVDTATQQVSEGAE